MTWRSTPLRVPRSRSASTTAELHKRATRQRGPGFVPNRQRARLGISNDKSARVHRSAGNWDLSCSFQANALVDD